jgi:hypothetical protein
MKNAFVLSQKVTTVRLKMWRRLISSTLSTLTAEIIKNDLEEP